MNGRVPLLLALSLVALANCSPAVEYDVILRNGTIYDGSGMPPFPIREEGILSLEEAIRKLTALPASNLRIQKRGMLRRGYFADIVVFDPKRIQDHSTFEEPHQYSTGVVHVFVNGVQVLKHGEHTGETPGRVVRGPGWKGEHSTSEQAPAS